MFIVCLLSQSTHSPLSARSFVLTLILLCRSLSANTPYTQRLICGNRSHANHTRAHFHLRKHPYSHHRIASHVSFSQIRSVFGGWFAKRNLMQVAHVHASTWGPLSSHHSDSFAGLFPRNKPYIQRLIWGKRPASLSHTLLFVPRLFLPSLSTWVRGMSSYKLVCESLFANEPYNERLICGKRPIRQGDRNHTIRLCIHACK